MVDETREGGLPMWKATLSHLSQQERTIAR
jgi:hypothetical protein